MESDDDVLKNEYTKDDFDSDGSDEDSGIKIDLEEEDAVGNDDDSISDDQDDELKFDIDEDVGDDDCIKIDIVDVRQKKNADQVKIDLTVSWWIRSIEVCVRLAKGSKVHDSSVQTIQEEAIWSMLNYQVLNLTVKSSIDKNLNIWQSFKFDSSTSKNVKFYDAIPSIDWDWYLTLESY